MKADRKGKGRQRAPIPKGGSSAFTNGGDQTSSLQAEEEEVGYGDSRALLSLASVLDADK